MSINSYNNITSEIVSPEANIDVPPIFKSNQYIKLKSPFPSNFYSQSSDEVEDISFFNQNDSLDLIPSLSEENNKPSLDELIPVNSIKINTGNISFPSFKSSNFFTNTWKNYSLLQDYERNLLKKRFRDKRPRRENQDNIRRKIKRGFFNNALIKKLNDKLRNIGIIKYFEKFPHCFVNDVDRRKSEQILGMTLQEIFETKKLYSFKDKVTLGNYLHNKDLIQNEEIKENEELNMILNKTIGELYEEYINSDEFKSGEINRLRKNKMQEDYIIKYVSLAKNLIEFFSKWRWLYDFDAYIFCFKIFFNSIF